MTKRKPLRAYEDTCLSLLRARLANPDEKHAAGLQELSRELISAGVPVEEIGGLYFNAIGQLSNEFPGLGLQEILENIKTPVLELLKGDGLAYRSQVAEIEDSRKELQQLASEQALLLETAEIGIVLFRQGRAVMANRYFETLYGFAPGQWRGEKLDYLHLDREAYRAFVVEANQRLKEGKVLVIEREMRRVDGSVFWCKLTGNAVDSRDLYMGLIWLNEDISEQKRAEEKLRRQAEVIEQIQDPIITADLNRRITSWNAGAERLFGYSAEETIGRHVDTLYAVLDSVPGDRDIFGPLTEKGSMEFETSLRKKNGETFDAQLFLSLLHDGAGNPAGLIGYLHDITEQKRAREALRRQAQIIEQIQDPVTTSDLKRHLTSWNKAAERFFGYTAEEAIGRHVGFLFADKDKIPKDENILGPLSEKGSLEFEAVMRKKTGETLDVQIFMSLLRGGDGNPIGIIGYQHDITEQKRVAEKLQQRVALIDQAHDGMIAADMNGIITSWNKGAERVYGWTEDEALGQHIAMTFPASVPDDWHWETMRPSLEHGILKLDGLRKRKSGEMFDTEVTLSLLQNEEGEGIGIVGTVRDVSERKRAENETALLQQQLFESQKLQAIDTLAGGVAHEFNNLLVPILGLAQVAVNNVPADSAASRDLQKIIEAATAAKSLVSRLLLLSRKEDIVLGPLDISTTVTNAVDLMRSILPASITITEDIQTITKPVDSDAAFIHQVIMNLGSNAVHAIGSTTGKLHFSLREVSLPSDEFAMPAELEPGSYVQLVVIDTGCGMDDAVRARIFEPFYTTKEVGVGTGLGLAVIHRMIEKTHGGAITVDSEPGLGTTFTIYLPFSSAGGGEGDGHNNTKGVH